MLKFKSVFNANKIVQLQMVKALKQPGPWLFCYSLTVVSCSSPLLSRPTQVTFSGLELTWQVSLTSLGAVVSCLKGILQTLRILDAVPEHPLCGAVLGLHVMCPAPALRRACSLQPQSGFSTPHHVALFASPLGPSQLCDYSSLLKKVLDEGLRNCAGTLESLFLKKGN